MNTIANVELINEQVVEAAEPQAEKAEALRELAAVELAYVGGGHAAFLFI
ncbi:MAG: hypothetical protein NZL99_10335 [Burkholderiaceae bacterium]|nr:hypothetical protein [Burkholderiaceae bacterium]